MFVNDIDNQLNYISKSAFYLLTYIIREIDQLVQLVLSTTAVFLLNKWQMSSMPNETES